MKSTTPPCLAAGHPSWPGGEWFHLVKFNSTKNRLLLSKTSIKTGFHTTLITAGFQFRTFKNSPPGQEGSFVDSS
jgi:hypothetical protein